ncbi:hypothetical protein IFM89_030492 [Coptis chinensis]|uniref:Flowering time control protein FCA n=1 Tax=Coptis chinensis TaxID=261450 RepID=A0A835HA31_9MAGN|nr:hypothetical protein IFM89_030492 [Coptis chinensis]
MDNNNPGGPFLDRKRPFPFSDNGGYVKLYVGSIPRTASADDVGPFFEEYGKVLEVFIMKDKRSGQQQVAIDSEAILRKKWLAVGSILCWMCINFAFVKLISLGTEDVCNLGCCFVKYETLEEAERAMKALHNQYTFPGELGPIQVRYADGEQERLDDKQYEYMEATKAPCLGGCTFIFLSTYFLESGDVYDLPKAKKTSNISTENGQFTSASAIGKKLFIVNLNKQAIEKDVEKIFSPYGLVEDIFLLRDEMKQSRGSGFVEFLHRDMAVAAMNALNGTYVMEGCDQPLLVRFAHPKRSKFGEHRNDNAVFSSGFGPKFHAPRSIRPAPNHGDAIDRDVQPNVCSLSQAHDFASHSVAESGVVPNPATMKSHIIVTAQGIFSRLWSKLYKTNRLREPSPNRKLLKPDTSDEKGTSTLARNKGNEQELLVEQTDEKKVSPGHHLVPLEKPLHPSLQLVPSLQLQTQDTPASSKIQASPFPVQQLGQLQIQTEDVPSTVSQRKKCVPAIQQQSAKPLQQLADQSAQIPAPQEQVLQGIFQSAHQAPSQGHEQLHLMQHPSQTPVEERKSRDGEQQQQEAARTAGTLPTSETFSVRSQTAPPTCEWSEHNCPDGCKYYYNCITKESRWEKPNFSVTQSKEVQLQKTISDQQRLQIHQTSSLELDGTVVCRMSGRNMTAAAHSEIMEKRKVA